MSVPTLLAAPVVPLRCLIIDDDPFQRMMLEHLIALHHSLVLVATAEDGLQGLMILKHATAPLDVLFLDIEMPHLDGIELLNQLKGRPLSVVLVSSRSDLADTLLEHPKVVDFIVKPITGTVFGQVVARLPYNGLPKR